MAGILGRSFPIRPHLARPVIGTPATPTGPFVYQTVVARQALTTARYARKVPPRPHLAPPIVGAPIPAVPMPFGTFIYQATERALTRRTIPRPHLAPLTLTTNDPFLVGFYVNAASSRFPRSIPRPHLARPIVDAAPAVAIVTRPLIVSPPFTRSLHRPHPRPHLAPPIIGVPAASSEIDAFVWQTMVTRQAIRRSYRQLRILPIRPHLAPPTLTAPAAPGAPLTFQTLITRQANQRARVGIGRIFPRPHLPAFSLLTTQGEILASTIVGQAIERSRLQRSAPIRPHLAPAIVGAPPTAGEPFVYQTLVARQARRRPYLGRTVPKPHLAPPVVTPVPPFAPGTFTYQAVARAFIGRTVPRPHLAPPTPSQTPVARGTFVNVAIRRSQTLRLNRSPVPHTARPLLPDLVPATGIGSFAWDFDGDATVLNLVAPEQRSSVVGFDENVGRPRHTRGH